MEAFPTDLVIKRGPTGAAVGIRTAGSVVGAEGQSQCLWSSWFGAQLWTFGREGVVSSWKIRGGDCEYIFQDQRGRLLIYFQEGETEYIFQD